MSLRYFIGFVDDFLLDVLLRAFLNCIFTDLQYILLAVASSSWEFEFQTNKLLLPGRLKMQLLDVP